MRLLRFRELICHGYRHFLELSIRAITRSLIESCIADMADVIVCGILVTWMGIRSRSAFTFA